MHLSIYNTKSPTNHSPPLNIIITKYEIEKKSPHTPTVVINELFHVSKNKILNCVQTSNNDEMLLKWVTKCACVLMCLSGCWLCWTFRSVNGQKTNKCRQMKLKCPFNGSQRQQKYLMSCHPFIDYFFYAFLTSTTTCSTYIKYVCFIYMYLCS